MTGLTTLFVDRIVVEPSGCWSHRKKPSANGYRDVYVNGRRDYAHRVMYEWFTGTAIPDGLQIDHLCRNRGCLNPEHLEVVTQRENILRGKGLSAQNARKTHCSRGGHPYDEANTVIYSGRRFCRACIREKNAARPRKGR